ncbi:DUF3883 domain-containing protein [Nostoc ellipsosporum NOK]|nr:DUF3883 domain-containing protein [Nostoc ellipsosporum NOK]
MPAPWTELVKSAAARRSRDAPFFKPVCLIAIVDLIDEGRIDAADIDADVLAERVSMMVDGVHRGRADMRWRPIWHLSNDGAWIYTKAGRQIGPEDFEPARKPDSWREWRESFDKIAVPGTMLAHWRSASHRAALRRAALAMLENGDGACRTLAAQWGGEPAHDIEIGSKSLTHGQGFLADADARAVVERHAMSLVAERFEADGWTVADRSATESYDLLAEAGEQLLFIEVKGTTGCGDVIQLTRREVEFAQANGDRMALAVVAHIVLAGAGDQASASGGELVVRRPWTPAPSTLQPIAFTCRLE